MRARAPAKPALLTAASWVLLAVARATASAAAVSVVVLNVEPDPGVWDEVRWRFEISTSERM
jgi:hypothetical protein